MKTVEVITRKGCHLCDLALGELDIICETFPFSLKLTYLDDHPELNGKFGNDIPVILVDQIEVCRHRIDRAAMIAALFETASNRPR
ncbi:MAG TPA: glutaredoxin family protein [Bacteroidota bacterium]|nr:glutaredoxin family protein [Bacteroidota bacterium]